MSDIEIEVDDMIVEEDLFSDEDFLEDDEEENEEEENEEEEEVEEEVESVDDVVNDFEEDIGESTYPDITEEDITCQTVPRLTKYEQANIIGLRATQIQAGSKPFINLKTLKYITPITIAEEELKQHKLDFLKVKRTLPSGKVEIISLKHLKF